MKGLTMSMNIGPAAGMSALHAMTGASSMGPPQQKMSNLFDAIDVAGAGAISKDQFLQAFASQKPPAVFQAQGADAIFSALDPKGVGRVSKSDFVETMTKLMVTLRRPPVAPQLVPGAAIDPSASPGQAMPNIDLKV
jgi:EF-hand domain pair